MTTRVASRRSVASIRVARVFVREWAFRLAIFAAVLWFSYPTLVTLHLRWIDGGYTHGYLVLVLSVVLASRSLRRKPLARPSASLVGAFVMASAVLLVLAAQASTTVIVAQLTLPLLWLSSIWAVLGRYFALSLLPAIGLIYFAIPIWYVLTDTLQAMTVHVVTSWIRLADIPAFIEGNWIFLPVGTFEVADGCSGLGYLTVGLAISAYLALSRHTRWSSRLAILGLAVILVPFANWVRVFSVVIAGHATSMQHSLIEDHSLLGWVLFFILFLIPLMILDHKLPDGLESGRKLATSPQDKASEAGISARVAPIAIVIVLIMAGLWGQARMSPVGDIGAPLRISPEVNGWQAIAEWVGDRQPRFEGADAVASVRFSNGNASVDYYRADYAFQGQEREVVYHANRPEGTSAKIERVSDILIGGPYGDEAPFLEIEVVDADSDRRLLWFGRRIGHRWVTSPLSAKLWQVVESLTGRPEALVVVLSSRCMGDCPAARHRLEEFANAAGNEIFQAFETVESSPPMNR